MIPYMTLILTPVYLSESLHSYDRTPALYSSLSLNLLTAPYCRTKLGRRRFSCWDQFTCLRTDYNSLRAFKNKTFLYRRDVT